MTIFCEDFREHFCEDFREHFREDSKVYLIESQLLCFEIWKISLGND